MAGRAGLNHMSYTNSVNSATSSLWSNPTQDAPSKTIGQKEFLKLLVTQMTTQDPMNPQSNAEFATQMTQFSSMQAAQDMRAELAQLRNEGQVGQAGSLLGRQVTFHSAEGEDKTGTVSAVHLIAGRPQLVVDGVLYDPSQIFSIEPFIPTVPSSSLIA